MDFVRDCWGSIEGTTWRNTWPSAGLGMPLSGWGWNTTEGLPWAPLALPALSLCQQHPRAWAGGSQPGESQQTTLPLDWTGGLGRDP